MRNAQEQNCVDETFCLISLQLVRMNPVLIYMDSTEKVPWNLNVNAKLKREMAVYCASIGRDISDVTEELYIELLKKVGVSVKPSQKKRKRTGCDVNDLAIQYLNRLISVATILGYSFLDYFDIIEGFDLL